MFEARLPSYSASARIYLLWRSSASELPGLLGVQGRRGEDFIVVGVATG